MKKIISAKKGFTLIEVSMVLLLFSAAIGGLLSFFPVGLRQSASAVSDTTQSMFALNVLGQIEANAAKINELDKWTAKELIKNITVDGNKVELTPQDSDNDTRIDDYLKPNATIRYQLKIFDVTKAPRNYNGRLKRVQIYVTDSKNKKPTTNSPFIIDVYFRGVIK